jgi:hypothetical protein
MKNRFLGIQSNETNQRDAPFFLQSSLMFYKRLKKMPDFPICALTKVIDYTRGLLGHGHVEAPMRILDASPGRSRSPNCLKHTITMGHRHMITSQNTRKHTAR